MLRWTIYSPWTQKRVDGIKLPQKVIKKSYSELGREGNVLNRTKGGARMLASLRCQERLRAAHGGPRGQCRSTRHNGPWQTGH